MKVKPEGTKSACNSAHEPTRAADEQIADLPLTETDSEQVKGGPIFMEYEGIKGRVTAEGSGGGGRSR